MEMEFLPMTWSLFWLYGPKLIDLVVNLLGYLPSLPGSRICPLAALKALIQVIPGPQDDPLFSIVKYSKYVPVTDSMVREDLKRVINILNWHHFQFTFHSFRRSGASWAFQHDIPIETIKQQGT